MKTMATAEGSEPRGAWVDRVKLVATAGDGRGVFDPISPLAAFDRYAAKANLKPATVQRWRSVAEKIQKEHPTHSQITPEWCEMWRDELLASGLSPATVSNVHIAGLRALCGWAVTAGLLTTNPAQNIRVRVPVRRPGLDQIFSVDEVEFILSATLGPVRTGTSRHRAAAIRWMPWLCAYLGARIGEIARLQRSDIHQVDGIWFVSIQSGERRGWIRKARQVPLHPHLIEQGFIEFVIASGNGLLFCGDAGGDGQPSDAEVARVPAYIAKWVRRIGVDRRDVSPNSAWRRRFRMVARNAQMNPEAVAYMMGHPVEDDKFRSHFPPDFLFEEISRFPRIEVA